MNRTQDDPHRPRYHFSPDNWMNDPIPFFWDGAYHIFFQHNPHGAYHADMHWGHAVSRDLVHWEQMPIALAPTPGGPDHGGVWTGCVVESDGTFYAFYTGITPRGRQVQCVATSRDLMTWEKYPGNPVIADQPEGVGECFRDPCVWREGDGWSMLIGSELPEGRGGAALLYRSEDLVQWEYRHVFCTSPAALTGHDFECPDFFPLGGAHCLLTSRGRTHWQMGHTSDHTFTAERVGPTDTPTFYAAKTLLDAHERRLLFGWLREERPDEAQRSAGWSGVLSLPRVLTRLPNNALGMEPAPELRLLRGPHQHWGPWEVSGAAPLSPGGRGAGSERASAAGGILPGARGDALEIQIQFAPTEAIRYGVRVCCSPDGADYCEIAYDRREQETDDARLILAPGEGLTLRVFVDHSVVEAFACGRACWTRRFYPERPDCLGVAIFAEGRSVRVESVDIWEVQA